MWNKKKTLISLCVKCLIVYTISISAIIRADFRYVDDMGRIFDGSVDDWNIYIRPISQILCKILSANNLVTDVSPLSQIITLLFMAISVTILIWAIAPECVESNRIIIAALPFAISPYFMENISYKIECVVHGGAVLISVLPVLLYKRRNFLYMICVACCTLFMLITYQSASGVFPIAIIMIAVTEWNEGKELKTIIKLIWNSVLGYALGLLLFKLFIMKPINTWVSSEMFSVQEMPKGTIYNLIKFYTIMANDFKTLWLILISVIVISYVLVYTLTAQKKIFSFIIAVGSILLMCSLCFGIYVVLKVPTYNPRSMYVVGIVISLLCIFVVAKGNQICVFIVAALAWCFVSFALNYGNCLSLQQEYTSVRTQAIIDFLNQNYDENISYVLQIDGNVGLAPSIRTQCIQYPLLNKLIPLLLNGGWNAGQYKIYKWYGLPANYKVVWAGDRGNKELYLLDKNLPQTKNCMWFDVYSDGKNILIRLKN